MSLNPVVRDDFSAPFFDAEWMFGNDERATTVRNGGFPPLLLDPVDFVALYRQKMEQLQPQQATV